MVIFFLWTVFMFFVGFLLYPARAAAYLHFVTHFTWLTWMLAHPWLAGAYTATYLVIGAAWSVVHWWLDETERVREFTRRFYASQKAKNLDTLSANWSLAVKLEKTRVNWHTSDFIRWISLWPLSLPITFLNGPFRRLVRHIVAEMTGVYQRITDKVWNE